MKSSLDILDSFESRIIQLEYTRKNIENTFTNNNLALRDVKYVYESLFINIVNLFEQSIEELFIGLLTNRIKHNQYIIHPRVTFNSQMVARDVIKSNNKYIGWLPYQNTKDLAKIYFRAGRPFSFPDHIQMGALTHMLTIRNAIAHKSRVALDKFHNNIISNQILLPREKSPAGFLRSQFRATPNQIRHQHYLRSLASIMETICT